MRNSSNIPRGKWSDFRYLTSSEVLARADTDLGHLINKLNSYAENEDILFEGENISAFKFKCKDIVDNIGRLRDKIYGTIAFADRVSRKY